MIDREKIENNKHTSPSWGWILLLEVLGQRKCLFNRSWIINYNNEFNILL